MGSIWRGPFYVGPLVRPVSTGDAILKFLETIWRSIFIVFTVGLIGAILVALVITWENANRPPSVSDVVKATVTLDRKVCSEQGYPLVVSFNNPSNRTVENIHFNIIAKEPGHSTNLSAEFVSRESDEIIPPRSVGTQCWSKPELKEQIAGPLVYSVNIEYGSWQE